MPSSTNAPKVFISYSWHPVTNGNKALALAERLSGDGVHVIIDKWDLKEGQDKYVFMEKLVTDKEVRRVLLICNRDYAEKANERIGGVGTESLIISSEIYEETEQIKFIPVIFEVDEQGKPYVPQFVKSRIYIDLSQEEHYEENYEMLVRNIFDKPASRRPVIGLPPSYITQDAPVYLPVAHKRKAAETAVFQEKRNAILLVQDYFDSVIESLNLFKIQGEYTEHDAWEVNLLQNIEQMRPLREDVVTFITYYQRHQLDMDMECIHLFFEKLLNFIENIRNEENYLANVSKEIKADNFYFFGHELFLYVCTAMIKCERFKELHYLLNNDFVVTDHYYTRTNALSFTRFRRHLVSLDEHRNKRLKMNRKSITADLLKQRSGTLFSFDDLKEADALLYYLSIMKQGATAYMWWWPVTSAYDIWNLNFMKRGISNRFFNKVKALFGVDTIEEMREKVISSMPLDQQFSRFDYSLPMLAEGLHVNELCQIP